MAIPKTKNMRQPILEYLGQPNGRDVKISGLVKAMAEHFGLAKEDQEAKTPGGSKIFASRVNTTVINLKYLGLVESPRHGYVTITQKARDLFSAPSVPEAKPEKDEATGQRSVLFNEDDDRFIQMATTIAASYVANNPAHFEQIPEIIKNIYEALLELRGHASSRSKTAK